MSSKSPNPFFSIVVCCWNSAPFIQHCIQSLRQQRYSDFEVVFVDGGSTDGTLDLIASSGLRREVLYDVRGGIAAAMNAGLKAASGRYVAHLHADDYYLDESVLADVAAALEAQPDAVWAFGGFMNDIAGVVQAPPYLVKPYSRSNLLRRNLVPHVSTFVQRKAFLEEGGFDPSYKLAMDYELWLRLCKRADPVLIPRALGAFRRHPGSATTRHALRSFNEDALARFRHSPIWLWPEFSLRYLWRRLKLLRHLA